MSNLDHARDTLERVPDLLQHLCHLIEPGGHGGDGQPVARDLQSAPARLMPMDEVDAIFKALWESEAYWRDWLDKKSMLATGFMVRRDEQGNVLGPRGIVGNPNGGDLLHVQATTLVNRHILWWRDLEAWSVAPDLERQAAIEAWCLEVAEWAGKPLARWPMTRRDPVPAKARQCQLCDASEVYADLDELTGLCRACGHVHRAEVWVTLTEAGLKVGKGRTAIQNWIDAGEIGSRMVGKKRMVDLHKVQDLSEYKDAKRRAGIA